MRAFRYLLSFAITVFAVATAADIPEEDDVLVLTDANFKDAIAAHSPLLVEFYAPWCGHCKSLAPEYAKAAKELKKEGIRIAKLDATAHKEAAEKNEIQGFPTLLFFKGDNVIKYEAGRTADAIVNWIRKKTGPACKVIDTVAELENFQSANEVVVLGLFKDLSGDNKEVLEGIADKDDSVVYGVASDPAVWKQLGVTKDSIVLLKKFDEKRNDFTGALTDAVQISDFVKSNSLPLVITFNDKNAQKIFGGEYDTHLLFFLDTEKHLDANQKALETLGKNYRGKAIAVIVPLHETRIVDYFGVKAEDTPRLIVVKLAGGIKKYEYPVSGKDIDAVAAGKFIDSFFDGKVSPSLKSDPIPSDEQAYDNDVRVLVGKNFNDVVLNSGKDVLVEFYAPWCGHCKALAPKYEELAERFKDVDSLVIAKMDSTANEIDHPAVNIQGFPTILFFPANNPNEPLQYDGARDVDGFVQYLKKKVTIGFELDDEIYGPGPGKKLEKEDL